MILLSQNTEFVMKEAVSILAALALVAPAVASASPAAESLSLKPVAPKSAAVKPVRASAKSGENKAIPAFAVIALVGALAVGTIVAVTSGDDSR